MGYAVEVNHLRKEFKIPEKREGLGAAVKSVFSRKYSTKLAVEDISLTIEPGELVGFLGPNGAGKTTTIKMLSGIIHPTNGEIQVLGHVPFKRDHAFLRQISLVMGNKMQLWWDLPAWDGFLVLKELYDVDQPRFDSRVERLCDALQLSDHLHRPVRQLSLGERMKCELVASLLHSPRMLFLDEPTLGLDVVSQKRMRDFLLEINEEEKTTMLLTSHYMQDVQELCDRVIVIDHGKILFDGALEALVQRYANEKRLTLRFSREVERSDVEAIHKVTEFDGLTAAMSVTREEITGVTTAVLDRLPVHDLGVEDVPIEEVISKLFQRV